MRRIKTGPETRANLLGNRFFPERPRERGLRIFRSRSGLLCQALTILLAFYYQPMAQPAALLPEGQLAKGTDSGLLKPAQQGTKWGYIDPEGRFAISPKFDWADTFSEGVAAVEINKRFGYIGPDGHFVIQPKYFDAGPFKDGLALVSVNKPVTPLGTGEYGVVMFAHFTYIDRSGREIRSPFSVEYAGNFSDGLAAVKPGVTWGGCRKGGYLNATGQWAITPQFDEVGDFSEGLAAVNRGSKCHFGGKWGYVDKDGTMAIPFRFDYAGQFKNGSACVEEGKQWKLIDANGKSTPVEKSECLH